MKKKYRICVYTPRGTFFSKIKEYSEEEIFDRLSAIAEAEFIHLAKEDGMIFFAKKTLSESVIDFVEVKE